MEVEERLDLILNLINKKTLSFEEIQKNFSNVWTTDVSYAISHLLEDGYIIGPKSFTITAKGKMFLKDGGYAGRRKRSHVTWKVIMTTLIVSILSLVVTILSFLYQFFNL